MCYCPICEVEHEFGVVEILESGICDECGRPYKIKMCNLSNNNWIEEIEILEDDFHSFDELE